jgi:hypothetical protein
MKVQLNHIAITTPSYFLGSALPVVQVYVDENSTYREIKNELMELATYEHLPEEISDEDYLNAVEDLFRNFSSLDYVPDSLYGIGSVEDDDYTEGVYFYFSVEVVEE